MFQDVKVRDKVSLSFMHYELFLSTVYFENVNKMFTDLYIFAIAQKVYDPLPPTDVLKKQQQ